VIRLRIAKNLIDKATIHTFLDVKTDKFVLLYQYRACMTCATRIVVLFFIQMLEQKKTAQS